MLFRVVMVSVMAVSLPTLGAEQRAKPAWEWTVEERIAARTNPELARERARDGARRNPASTAAVEGKRRAPVVDNFNGKTHPELFLPHQVFDQLVKLAFTGDARASEIVQSGFASRVREHGLPNDFWERLRVISAVYVADENALTDALARVRRESGARRQRAEQTLAITRDQVCRSRADALAEARRVFGRERFDRFLYEAVAPGMFSTAFKTLPKAELLRKTEEGCR